MTVRLTGMRLTGIQAGYRPGQRVLGPVDLDVSPGQIVTVLGPSGSGKTTMLNVIAGLLAPSAGVLNLGEQDITTLAPQRRGFGLVPQDGALFGHLTVAANVGYGIRGLRARRAGGDRRVQELLELVGMGELADRFPQELSGGQRQRVALARALAPQPRLVLLDEPFSALDAGLRVRLREEVMQILRDRGVGVLLITHDQEEALAMSDEVAVMREGLIVQVGSPQQVYRSPVDPWTAQFLGEAIVLPATAQGAVARSALGPVPLRRDASGEVTLIVRPEQVRFTAPGAGAVRGSIRSVQYYGHDALVDVVLAGDGMAVRVRALASDVPADAEVGLDVTDPVVSVPAPLI